MGTQAGFVFCYLCERTTSTHEAEARRCAYQQFGGEVHSEKPMLDAQLCARCRAAWDEQELMKSPQARAVGAVVQEKLDSLKALAAEVKNIVDLKASASLADVAEGIRREAVLKAEVR